MVYLGHNWFQVKTFNLRGDFPYETDNWHRPVDIWYRLVENVPW